jgi:hypothetical protein
VSGIRTHGQSSESFCSFFPIPAAYGLTRGFSCTQQVSEIREGGEGSEGSLRFSWPLQ